MKRFSILFIFIPSFLFAQNPKKKAFERLKFYFFDLPLQKPVDEIRQDIISSTANFSVQKNDSCLLKAELQKYDRLNSILYASHIVIRCDSDTSVLTMNKLIVTSYYSNLLASKKEYNKLVAEFTELLGKPEEQKYGSKGETTGTSADFYSEDRSLHIMIFWGNKNGEEKHRVSVIYYK